MSKVPYDQLLIESVDLESKTLSLLSYYDHKAITMNNGI